MPGYREEKQLCTPPIRDANPTGISLVRVCVRAERNGSRGGTGKRTGTQFTRGLGVALRLENQTASTIRFALPRHPHGDTGDGSPPEPAVRHPCFLLHPAQCCVTFEYRRILPPPSPARTTSWFRLRRPVE